MTEFEDEMEALDELASECQAWTKADASPEQCRDQFARLAKTLLEIAERLQATQPISMPYSPNAPEE